MFQINVSVETTMSKTDTEQLLNLSGRKEGGGSIDTDTHTQQKILAATVSILKQSTKNTGGF